MLFGRLNTLEKTESFLKIFLLCLNNLQDLGNIFKVTGLGMEHFCLTYLVS